MLLFVLFCLFFLFFFDRNLCLCVGGVITSLIFLPFLPPPRFLRSNNLLAYDVYCVPAHMSILKKKRLLNILLLYKFWFLLT